MLQEQELLWRREKEMLNATEAARSAQAEREAAERNRALEALAEREREQRLATLAQRQQTAQAKLDAFRIRQAVEGSRAEETDKRQLQTLERLVRERKAEEAVQQLELQTDLQIEALEGDLQAEAAKWEESRWNTTRYVFVNCRKTDRSYPICLCIAFLVSAADASCSMPRTG